MGLNDLSKASVENIFSFALSKYCNVDEFLEKFESILKQLYEHKNYKGGWNQSKIDDILNEYVKKTNAIKKDYKDKKLLN